MRVPWDRGGLRTYLIVLALAFAQPRGVAFWWGLALLVPGIALHLYAKGCLRQDQSLATGGPYRFVRHPFYAANLMVDESIALMSGWWPLFVLLPVWWLLVYVPAMRQEEARLTRLFPQTHPTYQLRLPRLLPVRRPLPAGGEGFSWANPNIASDDVVPRALRLSALPFLFLVWDGFGARGLRSFSEGDASMLSAIALLLTIRGLASMLTCHVRYGKRIPRGLAAAPALRAATPFAVLSVAGLVRWGEVELDPVVLPVGILILAASVVLHLAPTRHRPPSADHGARTGLAAMAAECTALVGLAVLCELPWLGALPVLVYGALALDERTRQPAGSRWHAPSPTYCLLLVGGLAIALTKEML